MRIFKITTSDINKEYPKNKVIKDLGDLQFSDIVSEKQFGSGLPFIHFTILAGENEDGTIHSTGVEESIRGNGIKQNISAIEINKDNIESSLRMAFDNFAHHAIRVNRGLTWSHNEYQKPNRVIPGVVVIENVGQINVNNNHKDNEGHVWLNATGPETILAIEPLLDYYVDGNDRPMTEYRGTTKPDAVMKFKENKEAIDKLIKVYRQYA